MFQHRQLSKYSAPTKTNNPSSSSNLIKFIFQILCISFLLLNTNTSLSQQFNVQDVEHLISLLQTHAHGQIVFEKSNGSTVGRNFFFTPDDNKTKYKIIKWREDINFCLSIPPNWRSDIVQLITSNVEDTINIVNNTLEETGADIKIRYLSKDCNSGIIFAHIYHRRKNITKTDYGFIYDRTYKFWTTQNPQQLFSGEKGIVFKNLNNRLEFIAFTKGLTNHTHGWIAYDKNKEIKFSSCYIIQNENIDEFLVLVKECIVRSLGFSISPTNLSDTFLGRRSIFSSSRSANTLTNFVKFAIRTLYRKEIEPGHDLDQLAKLLYSEVGRSDLSTRERK